MCVRGVAMASQPKPSDYVSPARERERLAFDKFVLIEKTKVKTKRDKEEGTRCHETERQ